MGAPARGQVFGVALRKGSVVEDQFRTAIELGEFEPDDRIDTAIPIVHSPWRLLPTKKSPDAWAGASHSLDHAARLLLFCRLGSLLSWRHGNDDVFPFLIVQIFHTQLHLVFVQAELSFLPDG